MKKIIMLEHIGDAGHWEWYAIIKNSTPEKALKWYLSEVGLEDNIIKQDDGYYTEEENARAYEINLITI